MTSGADARLWTDDSGRYTLEANLLAFNENSVILQRPDHDLVAFPIEQLSRRIANTCGRKRRTNCRASRSMGCKPGRFANGAKIVGRVVDFAQGDMSVQMRRGRVYVNDRPLENLPEFYQLLLPQIVAHFENMSFGDRQSFESWLVRQRGQRRTYSLEGIVLETENGDEYSVPFFLFADDDQTLLKSGYEGWAAARSGDDFGALDDRAFRLRSLAAARQRDRQVQREIAQLQLKCRPSRRG